MAPASNPEAVYGQINAAWKEAGLERLLVMQTPGWETAVERVSDYCAQRGRPDSTMGPVKRDTWPHWVHILSHWLDAKDGHGHSHAECELELATLVIAALHPRP